MYGLYGLYGRYGDWYGHELMRIDTVLRRHAVDYRMVHLDRGC